MRKTNTTLYGFLHGFYRLDIWRFCLENDDERNTSRRRSNLYRKIRLSGEPEEQP